MNGNERNGKEPRYCYRYPHPSVTTDCVIFGFDGRRLHVLLVQRGADPYKGRWAFPGGFLNMDESAEEGALRELQEENLRLVDENADYATQIDALNAQAQQAEQPREHPAGQQRGPAAEIRVFRRARRLCGERRHGLLSQFTAAPTSKRQSYWAYSINLAIARGYTACPYCGG